LVWGEEVREGGVWQSELVSQKREKKEEVRAGGLSLRMEQSVSVRVVVSMAVATSWRSVSFAGPVVC
jgi:hypothetical protein